MIIVEFSSIFLQDDLQITYWENGEGKERYYWGGVDPDAGKGRDICGCKMTNSCDDPSLYCNCDMNDQSWRKDDGYIEVKADLPISKFLAGDTGKTDQLLAFISNRL